VTAEQAGEFVPDKREECACHRGCSTEPHTCCRPCVWPNCLTAQESDELMKHLDNLGW
jgi:hypothetical protein